MQVLQLFWNNGTFNTGATNTYCHYDRSPKKKLLAKEMHKITMPWDKCTVLLVKVQDMHNYNSRTCTTCIQDMHPGHAARTCSQTQGHAQPQPGHAHTRKQDMHTRKQDMQRGHAHRPHRTQDMRTRGCRTCAPDMHLSLLGASFSVIGLWKSHHNNALNLHQFSTHHSYAINLQQWIPLIFTNTAA